MTDISFPTDVRKTVGFLVFLISAVTILILFLWYARELFLVLFAGILLAVILRSFSDFIERVTGLRSNAAYAVTISAIVALLGLAGWALAPGIIRQVTQLSAVVPKALAKIDKLLSHSILGQYAVSLASQAIHQAGAANTPKLLSNVSDAVGVIVAIFVVGFYGALSPAPYLTGILKLVPRSKRLRARQVGLEVIETLRWWLLGQLVPMGVLGVVSMLYLWILHVPLAFTLGLITGVMIFIPYVGSILAGVVASVVAFERGSTTMISVIVFYIATHVAEGYFLTPLVQKRAVRLLPALTLAAQFLMWIYAGFLGVALATPLAAAGLTLVKELYLGEDVEVGR
jgi:predicted PurR-regulated permease PerM